MNEYKNGCTNTIGVVEVLSTASVSCGEADNPLRAGNGRSTILGVDSLGPYVSVRQSTCRRIREVARLHAEISVDRAGSVFNDVDDCRWHLQCPLQQTHRLSPEAHGAVEAIFRRYRDL